MRHRRGRDGPVEERLPALIFLAGCFILGLAAGCLLASHLGEGAGEQLSVYLNDYFSLLGQDGAVERSLPATLWEVFRWPLAAGVFGLTAFGVVAVPALICLRGFLLSYSISVFLQLFGLDGLLLALPVFGFSALFSVTALFVVGMDAFAWGKTLTAGTRGDSKVRAPMKRRVLLRMGVTFCWLTAGALAQYWLLPGLLRAAVGLVIETV